MVKLYPSIFENRDDVLFVLEKWHKYYSSLHFILSLDDCKAVFASFSNYKFDFSVLVGWAETIQRSDLIKIDCEHEEKIREIIRFLTDKNTQETDYIEMVKLKWHAL